MSEAKHTPGPWGLWDGRGRPSKEGPFIGPVTTEPVAILTGYHSIAATDANASVLAAATEMLALLKLALGDTEHVLSQEFWNEVRNVVAKAEGRT